MSLIDVVDLDSGTGGLTLPPFAKECVDIIEVVIAIAINNFLVFILSLLRFKVFS
jgi:hypothetical protein